jgi:hypothetical protein
VLGCAPACHHLKKPSLDTTTHHHTCSTLRARQHLRHGRLFLCVCVCVCVRCAREVKGGVGLRTCLPPPQKTLPGHHHPPPHLQHAACAGLVALCQLAEGQLLKQAGHLLKLDG